MAAALLGAAGWAAAADQDREPQADGDAKIVVRRDADDSAPARPKPDGLKGKGDAQVRPPGAWTEGARPVDRLLEYVKKNHPEEYERLTTLRRENPEAFQQELRRQFEEVSARFREQGPDPRRTNAWRRAEAGTGPRPATPDGAEPRRPAAPSAPAEGDGRRPQAAPAADRTERSAPRTAGKQAPFGAAMAEQMERVKGLVDEYHRAKGEARDQIRRRIREQIRQTYELRERDRANRIRQMEEELAHLKKEIEERRSLRDQIIDRKVDELLDEDPTAW
jgi:hypothetical protein